VTGHDEHSLQLPQSFHAQGTGHLSRLQDWVSFNKGQPLPPFLAFFLQDNARPVLRSTITGRRAVTPFTPFRHLKRYIYTWIAFYYRLKGLHRHKKVPLGQTRQFKMFLTLQGIGGGRGGP